MASTYDINVLDTEAYLELTDLGVTFPLTRFSSQFALNSIPQATCFITLGYDAKNTNEYSPIHNLLAKNLQFRQPAKVFMKVKNTYSENNAPANITIDKIFDDKYFVAFDGYMSGSGYRRSGGSIEYAVSLEHWLADLAVSSGLSADLQPAAPDNFTFPATFHSANLPKDNLLGPFTATISSLGTWLSIDVWDGIKRFFLDICKTTPIGLDEIYRLAGRPAKINEIAAAALGRFLSSTPYQPLKLSGSVPGPIANEMAKALIGRAKSTFLGQSIWDNLIIFSTSFLFNVIPLIEKALVAPKTPNLIKEYKEISSGEIFSFDLSTHMPRFISGVILKNPMNAGGTFFNSQITTQGSKKIDLCVGSYFNKNAPDRAKDGTIVFHASPEWLISEGLDVSRFAVPSPAQAKPAATKPATAANNLITEKRRFSDSFAHSVYGNEVLKYRNGQLSGRLRFDISPGTIVKVTSSQVVNGPIPVDELNNTIFAHVDSVATYVDAVSGQASTSFGLSSVRYEYENEDGKLTVGTNPLYANSFSGSPIHLGNL